MSLRTDFSIVAVDKPSTSKFSRSRALYSCSFGLNTPSRYHWNFNIFYTTRTIQIRYTRQALYANDKHRDREPSYTLKVLCAKNNTEFESFYDGIGKRLAKLEKWKIENKRNWRVKWYGRGQICRTVKKDKIRMLARKKIWNKIHTMFYYHDNVHPFSI